MSERTIDEDELQEKQERLDELEEQADDARRTAGDAIGGEFSDEQRYHESGDESTERDQPGPDAKDDDQTITPPG